MAEKRFTNYTPGLGSVGSYQLGGIPFASSSILVPNEGGSGAEKVSFPYVTRFVSVRNLNPTASKQVALRVGFSALGTMGESDLNPNVDTPGMPNYYFLLYNGETYTGEWRIQELWLLTSGEVDRATASVWAGLTPIPAEIGGFSSSYGTDSMAGTNWSGSIGVG